MPDITEYLKAQKQGLKACRQAQQKGEYPYLPALDSFLRTSDILTEEPLGVMDIPLDQIVGTKTAGRQQAFASNFMPIMEERSEFAMKWILLYDYQTQEGVTDPIKCYEYMNRYYVLEGNKRVSVFKYLGAFSIEGEVIRIVPRLSADPQVKIFYEYMEFFRKTGINYIRFSREGSFAALAKSCGRGKDEIWTAEQKEDFSSNYLRFRKIYEDLGGSRLSITTGDAFLFYISIYAYDAIEDKSDADLRKEISGLWREFGVIEDAPGKTLVFSPETGEESGLFSRFFTSSGSRHLNVAFVHDKPLGQSSWVYGHELGKGYIENVFGDRIAASSYFLEEGSINKTGVIESAIEDGNHIIFTTSEELLEASLKCALAHPEVKILNCCVNRPYGALRTYYGRMYEAKFLEGMIAGSMASNDRIAYQADYPIYGSIANINAFAMGAKMVNPRAVIYLNWQSRQNSPLLSDLMDRENICIAADHDFVKPGSLDRSYGLYIREAGMITNLAAPIWNWGIFYEKIIRDILGGSWNNAGRKGQKAYNYWWGISGGIIDLVTSNKLPAGTKQLIDLVKQQICLDVFHPFDLMPKQGERSDVHLTAEEIITMDYLAENVIGSIPVASELTEEGRRLTALQGISGISKTVEEL